ncbi:MAG: hypothetical protein LC804_20800 [Acidobacteria bacterium]|nr:hypothetical protein [Acidobacteriota bacterium]
MPAATILVCALSTGALAQAARTATPQATRTATPTPQAPAAKAKWVAPVKGIATIEVIKGESKRVGADMVTKLQIKNTSSGSIALLRVDEDWFNRSQKAVSADTQRYAKPFNPGEIIEISMRSPVKPDLYISAITFTHANGKVMAKGVKKFQ